MTDVYLGLYPAKAWDPFTLAEHNYEIVNVAAPNDDGCWDQMNDTSWTNGNCATQAMCNPGRKELGWGVTNRSYVKYHRDYTTKPLCLDKLRHTPKAREQLGQIVSDLKKVPAWIMSDFTRLLALRQSDLIYVAGSSLSTVTVTDSIFTNNCTRINLGSTANLPTSKLTMNYLNHYTGQLMLSGYFDRQVFEGDAGGGLPGKFTLMTDFSTQADLTNQNPALTGMYLSADFAKGGKFYSYGVMSGAGDWLFKIDPTPLRFAHIGSGILQRLFPYENNSTTVGLKKTFDPAYEAATYQLSHVYARNSRTVLSGETAAVGSDMEYAMRNLMGKWSWKNPPVIIYTNPTDGTACTIQNDKQNWGYFLGEYEAGMKSPYPEVEMWILHKREAAPVADVPRVATETWPTPNSSGQYQDLIPYNPGCLTSELV